MQAILNSVKHAALVFVLVGVIGGATAASPASAQVTIGGIDPNPTVQVSPKLTDAGTAFWTVRVDGSGFTPNSDVLIQVKDKRTGLVSVSEIIKTTPKLCFRGSTVCLPGGTFHFEAQPGTQCVPGREVRAYDFGMGAWVNPLHVGCQ